jgi:PLP dependent protein
MDIIAEQLQLVRSRLASACALARRPVQSVTLLPVSKTQNAATVRAAYNAGERAFGENYVQEAVEKIEHLAELRPHLQWHLIGPIQSNKTRLVAEHFDWVHTLDRLKIAQRLSEQRSPQRAPLQVCLQVNIDNENTKSGVPPADVLGLAQAVAQLPHLRLRGLMSIPNTQGLEPADQRVPHRALHQLMQQLQAQGLELDTLSMGMSNDLEAAIAEGATMVRVGSAIFGERLPR